MSHLVPVNWQNLDRNFNELLGRTNFTRIVKVMKALDWKWASWGTDREDYFPDEGELMRMAQQLYDRGKEALTADPSLLAEALDMGCPFETACGGLTVTFFPRGIVQLSFRILEVYDTVNDSAGDRGVFTCLHDAHKVWQ